VQGETLEIFHNKGTTVAENSLCEWVILTNPNKTIDLIIERKTNVDEIMNIEYETEGGTKTELTNKNITEWGETTFQLELQNLKKLKLRVAILNDDYAYTILIAQEGKDYTYPAVFTRNKALIKMISYILVIWFATLALSVGVFSLFGRSTPWFKNRKQKHKLRQKQLDKINEKEITKVMDNMLNGTYESLHLKHFTPNWIIWFESFKKTESVHLLNECLHLFHTPCLAGWYKMIARTRHLSWPDWDSKNSEKSCKPFTETIEMKTENEINLSDREWNVYSKTNVIRATTW